MSDWAYDVSLAYLLYSCYTIFKSIHDKNYCLILLVLFLLFFINHHGTYESEKAKKKIVKTTIEMKKEIIRKHKSVIRVSDLALQYCLAKSSIYTISKSQKAKKKLIFPKEWLWSPSKDLDIKSGNVSPNLDQGKAVDRRQYFGDNNLCEREAFASKFAQSPGVQEQISLL